MVPLHVVADLQFSNRVDYDEYDSAIFCTDDGRMKKVQSSGVFPGIHNSDEQSPQETRGSPTVIE